MYELLSSVPTGATLASKDTLGAELPYRTRVENTTRRGGCPVVSCTRVVYTRATYGGQHEAWEHLPCARYTGARAWWSWRSGGIVPIHRAVWHGCRRVRLIAVRGGIDREATSRSNLEVTERAVWLRATWVTLGLQPGL